RRCVRRGASYGFALAMRDFALRPTERTATVPNAQPFHDGVSLHHLVHFLRTRVRTKGGPLHERSEVLRPVGVRRRMLAGSGLWQRRFDRRDERDDKLVRAWAVRERDRLR